MAPLAGRAKAENAPMRRDPLSGARRQVSCLSAMDPKAERGSQERQFALLVSSAVDYAIFMPDVDGHVLAWNERLVHRLGGEIGVDSEVGRGSFRRRRLRATAGDVASGGAPPEARRVTPLRSTAGAGKLSSREQP